jgi:hypothetical protein
MHCERLIAVVVVLVPIAVGAPPVFVLVPPPMLLAPAALSRFVQFTTLVLGLSAAASMSLDGFMQFMLGMSDAALTAVNVFAVKARHRREK